jgi:hypothetical protein
LVSQPRPELPTLTVVGGPRDGQSTALAPGETVLVGSGRDARLRLEHPEIAAAHVRVTWDEIGVSLVDAGSGKGTWVNGEPAEVAPLVDGDLIQLADPARRTGVPRLRVGVPAAVAGGAGSGPVIDAEEAFSREEPPAAPAPRARSTARRARPAPRVDPRRLGLVAAAALGLLAGGWLANRLFFTAPRLREVLPTAGETGQTVTVNGARFELAAAANTVWFGAVPVPAEWSTEGSLQVKVPAMAGGEEVALSVQTRGGRSGAARFRVLPLLVADRLEPEGALPGDEVVLRGLGFGAGRPAVNVAGVAAEVLGVEANALRFRVPPVRSVRGRRLPVIVTLEGRSTPPLDLLYGRVPLVASVEPAGAMPGELVRIEGAGFSPDPGSNDVRFDGVPALVVSASRSQLAVVPPVPERAQVETLARLVVRTGARASEETAYPLLRLVEGAWVPRCVARPADAGVPDQVLVGTEIAPLLLLSWRDQARTTAERALAVCRALDAAWSRARAGRPAGFEARDQPSPGVALAGEPELLVRATPEDARAYSQPPGLAPRDQPPSPGVLARHWAALLGDFAAIATSPRPPGALAGLSSPAAPPFAQLRAALPWEYGSGVDSAGVVGLSPDLRRRLREAALRVP